MFISKKHSISEVENIYKDLTRTYLNGLANVLSSDDLCRYNESTYLISEGYRHSLCLLFSLETETSTFLVKKYEEQFVSTLIPIYNRYNLSRLTVEAKRGILEACIHCIEKSRKLVDCI